MDPRTPAGRSRLRAIARRAMVDRGLEPEFSRDVLAELATLSHPAPTEPAIEDLRGLPWASIDNDDSRDLDQLSVTRPGGRGTTQVLVAVADVDALVRKDSAIDGHARTNTTSVYTAAETFPMLPEKLSTNLTSLNEGVERLAIVIGMEIDGEGKLGASSVVRARVLNHAKLAYNGVAAWLDGTAPAPGAIAHVRGLDEQLRLQDRIAQRLRRRRHEEGALSLRTAEPRPVFDGEALSDLREELPNRAKELIEEFMVAANGVTARFLEAQGFASLRRVLRSPERWERIVTLAKTFGERLPDKPDAAALDAFLAGRRDAEPDTFPDLSLTVVKLLGRGEYALERPGRPAEGHFGLAVRDYTHSTAPNRRFPDLITQRLIKAALGRRKAPYDDGELAALAQHCTDQETNADKVERRVRKSAAAMLLAHRVGERFDGIVTGASTKGTWVRITHPSAEGKVVRGEQGMDVGDHVRVQLIHTDIERGLVDFARAVAR